MKFGIAQLGLGLALELSLLQLDTDDGDEALAGIGAGKILVLSFRMPLARPYSLSTGRGQLKAFLVGPPSGVCEHYWQNCSSSL